MFFICRLPWVFTTVLYEFSAGLANAITTTIHIRPIYCISSGSASTAAGTAASADTTEAHGGEAI